VKAWLSRNEVPYIPHLLTDAANQAEILRRKRRPPLTVIGEEAIEGYDPPKMLAALGRAGMDLTEALPRGGDDSRIPLRFTAPLSDGIACTGFLSDSLTFVNARSGRYLGMDRASSSIPVGSRPISIAVSRAGDTFASVNHEAGSVTFLSLKDGSYLGGTCQSATRPTGDAPLYALAHPQEPLLYVSNSESKSITVFDTRSGEYAFGDLERSRVPLPEKPGVMALNAAAGILYVRLRNGVVAMIDARRLKPLHGDFDDSSFPVGLGRGIALSADARVLYLPRAWPDGKQEPEGLALFDALTGRPLNGTPEGSFRPGAAFPFAVVAHPRKPIVYVACLGAQVVEMRDAGSGNYLNGTQERSTLHVGSGARGMTVDPSDDCLYVTSFDDNLLYMFDATSGAWRFGTREASTLPLGAGPRDLCVLGSSAGG
jgi:6-phosphogluconolactonase (cycloisomerase 2 family)